MINSTNFNNSRQVFFHIPHDGECFPEELMKSVCIPDAEFRRYHNEMRDYKVSDFVPEAYRHDPNLIAFPISRLLCDVEWFIGPADEFLMLLNSTYSRRLLISHVDFDICDILSFPIT